jgi:curved DNA-binding protein CbpA
MSVGGNQAWRGFSTGDHRHCLQPLSKSEYRELVKVAHPDQGGNDKAFEIVQRLKPK